MQEDFIEKLNNEKGTVLVEFYASWCPHCQRMMPVVDDIKALVAGQAEVYQFDIDENSQLAERFGVESIPTFIVFKDGRETWRASGEMDGSEITRHLL